MTQRFRISRGVSELRPFELAGHAPAHGAAPVRLHANENCLGASPAAVAAIRKAAHRVNAYPTTNGFRLREAMATRLSLDASQIIPANGSTEILELLARAFLQPGDQCITADGTFILYRMVTLAADAEIIAVPLRDFHFDLPTVLEAVNGRTKIIFLANPNNPTGTFFGRNALQAFLRKVPDDVIVALDEAYHEYVTDDDYPDGVSLIPSFPNLVVLRTFSKIHGLAGLRLGYGLASKEVAELLDRVRSPYNVSMVAEEAGIAALNDTNHIRKSKDHNASQLSRLYTEYSRLGLQYMDSAANFVFVRTPDARSIASKLASRGILVAQTEAFGLQHGLRITVGTAEENSGLLAAMGEILRLRPE